MERKDEKGAKLSKKKVLCQTWCRLHVTGVWYEIELIVSLKKKKKNMHYIMSIHYQFMNGGFMSTISGILMAGT